ncbi:MAG TPA: tetratricopeptide repeat protein [Candidatus Binatia bacterium]|nr:tetratricopeptide repeat protein [Candidatus Binatia bacterium]
MSRTAAVVLAVAAAAAAAPVAASLGDGEVAGAERRIRAAPTPAAWVALAAASMRKARETADVAWYRRAAAAVDRALALAPGDYPALRARAWVLLGLHDFRGARAAAATARAREPGDWWNDATVADACAELGDYECATAAVEALADRRPGIAAYTRVAFLRTLFGDRPGAIEALRLAVAAGTRADPESLAWTLVHLGHEHFGDGDLPGAAAAYEAALAVLPDYHLALGGLGRVRAAEGRLADATALLARAVARVPAPDLVGLLGDAHAAAGEAAAAEAAYALLDQMDRLARATGTTYGRELALFYADHDRRLDEALRLAREDAATRGGVWTDDALAWALYKNGRLAAAARASHRALRLGTPDAAFDYHAGLVAAALGRDRRAARHLRRALARNPYFDLRQAPRARAALAALETSPGLARAAAPAGTR